MPREHSDQLYATDTIRAGHHFRNDESIYSFNGRYNVTLQRDGNLVIYDNAVTDTYVDEIPTHGAVWSSKTFGGGYYGHIEGGRKCMVHDNGSVVLYNKLGQPYWTTNTDGRAQKDIRLIMQDDGNLVLYGDGKAIWASGVPPPWPSSSW